MRLLLLVALAAGTGTIEGTLTRGDGTPWAGAQVTAFRLGDSKLFSRSVETDVESRYRIADLPPGRYALKWGEKPKPTPKGLFSDALSDAIAPLRAAQHGVITLAAGQTVRKDIRLPKQAPVRVAVTHRGLPVAGARVGLFPADRAGWAVVRKQPPLTDERGVAFLGKVNEGRYAVRVTVGDWAVFSGVHIVKDQPHRLPIELGKETVRVKVLDSAGKPLTRAYLEVSWGSKWAFVRHRDSEDMPARNGVFTVPYVRASKVDVWVEAKGDATAEAKGVAAGSDVVVRLPPTAVLLVRVVDARGKAVPEVHVAIENADSEEGTPAFGYDVDAKGEHRQDVTLRRWRVRIDDFDHGKGAWTIVSPKAGEERVVVLKLPTGERRR